MTLNEYQKAAMTTCMESCDNDAYMFYGLVGEVGEFASKIAKLIRKGKIRIEEDNKYHVISSDFDVKDIEEALKGELGDIFWFVAGIATQFGWELEQVGQYNRDKLASRQQRGVIDGNGDNR